MVCVACVCAWAVAFVALNVSIATAEIKAGKLLVDRGKLLESEVKKRIERCHKK